MSARAPVGASHRSDLFSSARSEQKLADEEFDRQYSSSNAHGGEGKGGDNNNNNDPLQLEHMLGYAGDYRKTVIAMPRDENLYVKSLGCLVSIENLTDPHDQKFLRGHDMPVSAIAISSDGRMIASGQVGTKSFKGNAAPVFLWNARSGQRLMVLRGLSQKVTLVAFSPDDKYICGCGEDGLLYIWDVGTSEVIFGQQLPKSISILRWISLMKVDHYTSYELVYGLGTTIQQALLSYDPMRVQWQMRTANYSMPPSGGLKRTFDCVDVSSDKIEVYIGTSSGDMLVFRRDTLVFRASIPVCTNGVKEVLVLPSGGGGGGVGSGGESSVLCGGGDGTFLKLQGRDSTWDVVAETRMDSMVRSLSLSANMAEVLASCSSGSLYRCLAIDLTNTVVSSAHNSSINCVAFPNNLVRSKSGGLVFCTGTSTGEVRVWDLGDYTCISCARWPKSGQVLALTMIDDESVLSCWGDGSVRCTDTMGTQKWFIPTAHRDGATTVAVHVDPNLQYFVTGGADGAVRVWKFSNRELVTQYTEHRKGVAKVVIDFEKPNIVHSVGGDCSVLSFDLKAGRRIICHIVNEGTMKYMTQRKDSERELITSDTLGRLLHWDIDLREPVMVVQDPSRSTIRSCEISPSGRFLLFAGEDMILKVLDIAANEVCSLGQGHTDAILAAAWAPDEKQIVTVGADTCLCVWNFFLGSN